MAAEKLALLSSPEDGGADDDEYDTDESLSAAGGWSTFQSRLMLQTGIAMAVLSMHMLMPIFLVPLLHEAWALSPFERGLISSVFFFGYLTGVFLWASVSDSRGRRPAIVIAFTLGNIAGIGSFCAPGFRSFSFMRFLCGVGVSGAKNGLFLLATEFATPDARSKVGAQVSYAWLAGLFLLVGVAWLLRDWRPWRWLVIAYVPALVVQIALPRLLPESPRYLLVAGHADRARLALLQVFKANGRAPPEPFRVRRPPASLANEHSDRPAASTFAQLWTRSTRTRTLLLGYCQGSCTMVFYAICFDTRFNGQAGGLYLGALLGALIELPAYLLLEPVTNRAGRKLAFSVCLFLTAACLLALHAVSAATYAAAEAPPPATANAVAAAAGRPAAVASGAGSHADADAGFDWLSCVLVLGGRFASVAAINVAYIVAAEIFPTSCRNSGIGWGTGCGRVGAIFAPGVMFGMTRPLLLLALLSLSAAGLVWWLPESVGVALSDVPIAEGHAATSSAARSSGCRALTSGAVGAGSAVRLAAALASESGELKAARDPSRPHTVSVQRGCCAPKKGSELM